MHTNGRCCQDAQEQHSSAACLLNSWLAGCCSKRVCVRFWSACCVLRASERASGVLTRTSTNNNSNKGGHKYKQGTEKKKEKKGSIRSAPFFPNFLTSFYRSLPSPAPPPLPPPKQNFSCSKNHEFVSIIR